MDLLELDRSIQIAKEAVLGGADWIEAGTPLIKSEGMDSVREMKKALPGTKIVADMKTVDTGAMEVEMAAKAGADIVALLAASDNSTVEDALRAARKYGVQIMMDLLTVPDPVGRSRELEELGVDYICVHVGIDQQMTGKDTIDFLKQIVKEVKTPVAAAGGMDAASAADAVASGAAIVIVGGSIVRSANVTESARKIRESIDVAQASTAPKMSLEEEIVSLLRSVSSSNISDAMHRKGAMRGIHPLIPGKKIVGKAITVQTFAGDWAKPVEAIDLAGPGDVLVIYNGSNSIAPWGGLATLSCKIRGIEGVVVDGAVRDLQEIRPMDYPLFSSDVVPNAGDPKGMGEINSEIVCGGQTVRPGDYIVGDDSGVVVIPKERAYEIARRAKEVEKTENRLFEEISRGKTLSQVVSLQKWEKIG
ncbi:MULTISPECIES: orotidine 5'-phosphate decarboxylase / HUMPS family protein [Methanothrix]|jgi:3-hexulose-6-phosphate synthase/6-phospho-3-hexuloisomerase|uniref:3-hexulose-6-phosphate synthase n=3 Tax=root TaxID=1 RepID=F4BWG9_METSG|nr:MULTISPECIES: orotidine 5'-phosphate decarboxylase / HUMPS family protein [Methanothrix]AEB67286.1 3-hexulose-6-phosphate synthase [Methanothrix soehngenii GP6]OPX82840.1 MAG: Bifunctional enzyme Fae/Hps [Methanosaeta sp. PtaB.Bin005]UEC40200.1 MAG: 3-hexulose-6-phosphate synthase [Methanothrix sp.]HNQ51834.1 orotidine 5'-phosphate decarboxylase [Methanothrix soehngenii]HPY92387.1 orotidine 5'-phosphate decarboxylase [Methanothrix soehngenii]